jgi:sugar phosphate isomerase/epimerase
MHLDPFHLTYCTNIHPARGFAAVWKSLERHALPLKASLSPDAPFGIGLRLSGEESRELLAGDTLDAFRAWLAEHGLYVFTVNGFPHGPFHGEAVKAQVHAPDWRTEERVAYTLRLARILEVLLPEGIAGGISTSPLSYKPWVNPRDEAVWRLVTENVVRVAEVLFSLWRERGTLIHLDLEPEPDGLLENSAELSAFFERWLLPYGAQLLAARVGVTEAAARDALLRHVQVCFDTCHVALAYERPTEVLERLRALGIRVGKLQVSSALALTPEDPEELRRTLAPFDEPVYLHQVVQRHRKGMLTRFADLPEALATPLAPDAAEWRVHFHVPVFVARTDHFRTTQETILETFAALREGGFTDHLEVETYTWSVLPEALRLDLTASIARELEWVKAALHLPGPLGFSANP